METQLLTQTPFRYKKPLKPSLFSSGSLMPKMMSEEIQTRVSITSYYDIPLPEDASELEKKICKYLEMQDIRVSHPSMKKPKQAPQRKQNSIGSLNRKTSFLENRNKKFSQSFKVVPLKIEIPQRASDSN